MPDPYAAIATPAQASDPYAAIAQPVQQAASPPSGPSGFWDTLSRENEALRGALKSIPAGVYHAFADPETPDEKQERETKESAGNTMPNDPVSRGIYRLTGQPIKTAVDWYTKVAQGKVPNAYESALSVAPEAIGQGAAGPIAGGLTKELVAKPGTSAFDMAATPSVASPPVPRATPPAPQATIDTAHANFMKAIPPTKTTPYDLSDVQAARPLLEDAGHDSPIKTPADVVDAANAGISRIENHVTRAIENHPGATLTTDPVAAARSGIAQSDLGVAKLDSADAGASTLDPYNFGETKTLAEADRIRRQLNASNRAADAQTGTKQFDSINTDPAYAARHYADDAIKQNLYDRLEELGEPGIGDLRAMEGSLVRIRNAAQAQIFNGEKAVGGTGSLGPATNAGRNLVRAGSIAAGVGLGSLVGGGAAETAGGILGGAAGEFINKLAFPGNITRSALIEKSFGTPVTQGFTLPEISAHPAIRGLLNAPPVELGASTATAPVSEPPVADMSTRAVRKGLLLGEGQPQLPQPGYTEPRGEPLGTPIGSTQQPIEQPGGWLNNRVNTAPNDATIQSAGQSNAASAETAIPAAAALPSESANGRVNPGAAVYEPRQPVHPVTPGALTEIRVAGQTQPIPAQYEIRDLSDVQPSHSGVTGKPNPKYALDHANLGSTEDVAANATKFDPAEHLTQTADATKGPLVIDESGHALGDSNENAMTLQRVYRFNPEGAAAYKMMLFNKAPQFGVDPLQALGSDHPVLVRKIVTGEMAHSEAAPAVKPTAASEALPRP